MKLVAVLVITLLLWVLVVAGSVTVAMCIDDPRSGTVFAAGACALAVFMLVELLRRELE